MNFTLGLVLLVSSIGTLMMSRPREGKKPLGDLAAVTAALLVTCGFAAGLGMMVSAFL